MESFFMLLGQIVFFIVMLGFAFGILYVFYDEYKIKYEMRKELEYKELNGVYTDQYKGWVSHHVIAQKVIEIQDQRYKATGQHYVPEMYTLICGWLTSINACSKYDITDHCKVMDFVNGIGILDEIQK